MNKLEICCGSYYDVKQAYLGGADRVELNSSLHLGGITPSLANLIKIKQDFDINTICMVRNRGGGFLYNKEDIDTMMLDAKLLLENGADGIAFGFLKEDMSIDIENTKNMVDIIKSRGKEAVFHRAFDCVKEPKRELEKLIALGVDRVLTSGQKDKAIDGLELIKNLNREYGQDIEILVGSGVNPDNVEKIVSYTNVYQVHSSCKAYLEDNTTSTKNLSYAYIGDRNIYDVVDKDIVKRLIYRLKNAEIKENIM